MQGCVYPTFGKEHSTRDSGLLASRCLPTSTSIIEATVMEYRVEQTCHLPPDPSVRRMEEKSKFTFLISRGRWRRNNISVGFKKWWPIIFYPATSRPFFPFPPQTTSSVLVRDPYPAMTRRLVVCRTSAIFFVPGLFPSITNNIWREKIQREPNYLLPPDYYY